MATILLLHGPNLNLLGQREPERYGNITLGTINQQAEQIIKQTEHQLTIHQSNSESELIDHIHNAGRFDMLIFNPAAFTHTSIALRDALLAINIPFIEVHLTNIYSRESYRQHSYFSDIAIGIISGFGAKSYMLALQAACDILSQSTHSTQEK